MVRHNLFSEWDVGVNYWLAENIVFKVEYQFQDAPANQKELQCLNLGISFDLDLCWQSLIGPAQECAPEVICSIPNRKSRKLSIDWNRSVLKTSAQRRVWVVLSTDCDMRAIDIGS